MNIYVVHDYDHVAYAGTNRNEAKKVVSGNGCIQIWSKGKMIGHISQEFKKGWVRYDY